LQRWREECFFLKILKLVSGIFKSLQGSSCVCACVQQKERQIEKRDKALKPNLPQDMLEPHLVALPNSFVPSSFVPSFVGWQRCNH
jgi:hypothetical protein